MNAIEQKELETTVIDAVLEFYRPYLEKDGRNKIALKVKNQIRGESEDMAAARQRCQDELARISQIINNLLDNLTATNRTHVDQRLKKLASQRKQLENRIHELDNLAISQSQISEIVNESMHFISGLEFTLHQGLAQDKLLALRQCIERIRINKPEEIIRLMIREISTSQLTAICEQEISLVNSR